MTGCRAPALLVLGEDYNERKVMAHLSSAQVDIFPVDSLNVPHAQRQF